MPEYKVWVQVEKIPDDDGEDYEDIGLPDPLGVFATQEEAFAFVRTLPGWDYCADTSDYNGRIV